jgi:quercetin dioxygenase-like cupin family protein
MRNAHLFCLLALLVAKIASAAEPARKPPEAIVTPLTTQELKNDPGKEILVLAVEYPPGSADPVHRHNAEALVYVLEGSIVMGVSGREPVTLRPGDTFHEGPSDVHTIGRNASNDKPARFVVFLLKDVDKPAVIPVD